MIKKFKLFENLVDEASDEFWKMVDIVDWNSMIEGTSSGIDNAILSKKVQKNLYLNYTFEQVKEFENEYWKIYYKLYDEFFSLPNLRVSDDGYTDLISSIVGKGKKWVEDCIKDPTLVIKMANDDDYVENFGYLFQANEDEYWELIEKYDPDNIRLAIRKYNL